MAVLGCPGKKTQRRTSRASTSGVWITTCTSSLQLPTLKRTVSEGRRVCVCKHVCLCVSLCLSVFARIVSIPFIILFAASDDSILVSKAVHIEINGITLKPAGKDTVTHSHTHTHTHTQKGACVYTFTPLIPQVVPLNLSPTCKHLQLCLLLTHLHLQPYSLNPVHAFIESETHTHTHTQIGSYLQATTPHLSISPSHSDIYTQTHTHAHTNHTSSCLVPCDPWPSLHFLKKFRE